MVLLKEVVVPKIPVSLPSPTKNIIPVNRIGFGGELWNVTEAYLLSVVIDIITILILPLFYRKLYAR